MIGTESHNDVKDGVKYGYLTYVCSILILYNTIFGEIILSGVKTENNPNLETKARLSLFSYFNRVKAIVKTTCSVAI